MSVIVIAALSQSFPRIHIPSSRNIVVPCFLAQRIPVSLLLNIHVRKKSLGPQSSKLVELLWSVMYGTILSSINFVVC